jgi:GntR family transcriptional regulator
MSEMTPSMYFHLDPRTGVAPYRQLVDQVRLAVQNGRLRGGDRLPSVREVVTQITINPNTVHRAYRELEYQGIAEGRAGLGTFITPRANSNLGVAAQEELSVTLTQWMDRARSAGLSEDEMMDLIRRLLHRNERAWS